MTHETIPTATPEPTLLIFGIAEGRFRPQAARFRADEIELARYLVVRLNLTLLPVDAQFLQEIDLTIPAWGLRPDDQVVIPYVRGEVVEQLRQLVQPAIGSGVEGESETPIPVGTPLVPKPPIDAKQAVRLWDGLGVGSLVLALETDETGAHSGWWEAIVLAVQDGTYLLRWREPEEGIIRRRRHHLALLHPDSGEIAEGEG